IDDERDVFAHGPDPPAAHTRTNPLTPDVSVRPSQPRRQPVSWVLTRSLDGGTAAPWNQVGSSSGRGPRDGPGPTYPSAAARLLTARGSSEETASRAGASARRAAAPR